MILFLFICIAIVLPIWQSFYNYRRYRKVNEEYQKLLSDVYLKSSSRKDIEDENSRLQRQVNAISEKYDKLSKEYDLLKSRLSENSRSHSDLHTFNKMCPSDIDKNRDEFVCWEHNGTRFNLVVKARFKGDIDYEPRCNYVNKGWLYPEVISENAQCCSVNVGDAYLQFRAPQKGIVYYQDNKSLNVGDIILSIESDPKTINLFEKNLMKEKMLEKKRKRDLEKEALQELIDAGEIFPDANRRPPIPKDVVDAVWNRDGGKCVYCGSTENLHLDHIIPFSKGGDSSVENLQLLCQKCNLHKSNKIG